MKFIFTLLCFFVSANLLAQQGDFLLLKKGSKTVVTYFKGSNMRVIAKSGASFAANIERVKNDSIFFKEYVVQQIPTSLGVYVLDTVRVNRYQYHYNDIVAIGKEGRRFNWAGSGSLLMGGSVVLLASTGIVYLVDNKNFSPELAGASVVLFGVGYLLSRNQNDIMKIGKKYKLVYVQAGQSQ